MESDAGMAARRALLKRGHLRVCDSISPLSSFAVVPPHEFEKFETRIRAPHPRPKCGERQPKGEMFYRNERRAVTPSRHAHSRFESELAHQLAKP